MHSCEPSGSRCLDSVSAVFCVCDDAIAEVFLIKLSRYPESASDFKVAPGHSPELIRDFVTSLMTARTCV